jgi:hypothetical protein
MKSIGTTTDGKQIVEMEQTEFDELSKLIFAVKNVFGRELYRGAPYYIDFDFTNVFQVIHAWWESRLRISEMQAHLDNMKRSLGNVEDSSSD